jgi:hypothetical protein
VERGRSGRHGRAADCGPGDKAVEAVSTASTSGGRGAANGVARLDVVINNVANTGEAVGKGGSGATYGLVGTQVTDHYSMRATFYPASGTESVNKTYRHTLHSTIGNKKRPPGLTPMKLKEGTARAFEQKTLTCLRDLQAEGKL